MEENINPETEQIKTEETAAEQTEAETSEAKTKQPESEIKEPAVTEPEDDQQKEQQMYQDPNADLYNSQYQQPRQTVQEEDLDASPLSLGDSLITMILFTIPCVNIIVAIVWACGGSKNITRRNLSRAQLIIWGAITILVLVFYAVLFGTIFGILRR